jgi:hypothetical protein
VARLPLEFPLDLDTAAGAGDTLVYDAVNNMWVPTAPGGAFAPAAHAASHEDGGGDEIDVTGLSGVLADAQNADQLQSYAVSNTAPTSGYLLMWCGSTSKWEPTAPWLVPPIRMSQQINWREEFAGGTLTSGNIGDNGWSSELSGTASAVANYSATTAARHGCVGIYTGTDSDGYATLYTRDCLTTLVGSGLSVEMSAYIPDEPISPDSYIVRFGLTDDNTDAQPTNGVWFEYDTSVDDFWQICTANAGSVTATVTAAVWTAAWHRYRFELNATGTTVTYYIDDVSIGTVGTNLPTNACGPFFSIIKTAGTNTRFYHIDYYHLFRTAATAR